MDDDNFYLKQKHLTDKQYGHPRKKQTDMLQECIRPHIESFNYMAREGLSKAIQTIPPVEFVLPNGQKCAVFATDAYISVPAVPSSCQDAKTLKVYPAECRERGTTYRGQIRLDFQWRVDNQTFGPETKEVGEVPIMVKSVLCNLNGLSPADLVKKHEEPEEMGGYFIINGIEKVIRMLVMNRRNFPIALTRPSWTNRGPNYTQYGISLRSVRDDQTSVNNVLHYLNNGTANFAFIWQKEQFFLPIIMVLKGLVDVTDQYIYTELIKGMEENAFYKGCVANMMRMAQLEGLATQDSVLKYIGERFRIKTTLPAYYTDRQVAEFLFRQCVCIHLESNMDKFHMLVYMTRKLFAFAKGECAAESADNTMFHEALLGGHLYLMALRERIEIWLTTLRTLLLQRAKSKGSDFVLDVGAVNDACRKVGDVGRVIESMLSTGNLNSRTGLGLMQASGLTVVADKLNFFRYLSHFRSIHRGAFFTEMRTTAVRKLLPEAWGFVCPVHTPDGTPCGLLNHLSANCQVVNVTYSTVHIPRLLCQLGMIPYDTQPPKVGDPPYTVMLDGRIIGWLPASRASDVANQLRTMKVQGLENVPPFMEICLIPRTHTASQYPGFFLFTGLARLMRPVKNLALKKTEMIGSFEQVYMNICIVPEEAHKGITTHMEVSEDSMLSVIASFTPFSDYNQSPRNMYQCQMGKQTMGTPCHAYPHRSDNKLYRILTPQSPIVRPRKYDKYNMDEYPLGTNAIVAVISYTGYDMEDAMILNKASYERGFGHGCIYKTEHVDLVPQQRRTTGLSRTHLVFQRNPSDTKSDLEEDGLPSVGKFLQNGDAYYSCLNLQTGEYKIERYKSQEPAYVERVKLCGNDSGTGLMTHVCFTLRIVRNPIIGDKFSSRHGQKGICSQRWPVENMPFTESGMTPDILFNPHGFPSRMTIGMMIESMAGKSAAMHGLVHDATPFTFSEDYPPIDYFGKMLTKAGYNYHGTERMYSGIDGTEFEADIFIGVVYYQRLRHMVSDKFQVRTTGPVDPVTHQPVKGRKRGGGVRFGEMERDALISHGTSFLLEDRLLNCSDKSLGHVCKDCGSILSPMLEKPPPSSAAASYESGRQWSCSVCKSKDAIVTITVPYVFRYLVAELAAMNIKVKLDAATDHNVYAHESSSQNNTREMEVNA